MAKNRSGVTGEEILLVVDHVKHRGHKGSVYVTSQNLAFQLHGKDIFEYTYHFSDIKTQKISAEGKSKVQLRIVLQDDEQHNFHFLNPKGETDQLNERNAIKDYLQQLLPKFRKKISKEIEEKSRILQTDRRMFQLYSDLVTTGIITADEFWAKNADKLKGDVSKGQEIGISGAFLADVTSQNDGCNSVRYNLTPEVIQSVFKTYPAVKRKHAEMVPSALSENEFWTKFFQSHYFHMGRNADKAAKDNIFGDAPEAEATDSAILARKALDATLNLSEIRDLAVEDDEGFGLESVDPGINADSSSKTGDRKKPANMTNHQLIQRFNLHSSRILSASENKGSAGESSLSEANSQEATPSGSIVAEEPEQPSSSTALPMSESELDLLKGANGPNRLPLRLKKTDRYHQAPAKRKADGSTERNYAMAEAKDAVVEDLEHLTKPRKVVINTKATQQALLQLAGGKNRRQGQTGVQLPESFKEELRNAHASLAEILRHYWSCYPTTDKFLEEKLVRMKRSLEKFQSEVLRKLAEKAAHEGQSPQIFAPLYEMIKAADIRFATQMKRST